MQARGDDCPMMRRKDYEYIVEVLEMAKDCSEQGQSQNALGFIESALCFLQVQQTTKPPYAYPFHKIDAGAR